MAFSTHDQVTDSPTNVFATMNAINLVSSSTLTDGNLRCNSVGTNTFRSSVSTIKMPNTGVYYIEFRCNTALDNLSRFTIGLTPEAHIPITNGSAVVSTSTSYLYTVRTNIDSLFIIESAQNSSTPSYSSGMIIQVLYDASNNKIWFGKNNTWYGSSGSLSSPNFSTDQTGSVASNIDLFFTVEWASEVGTALHGHVNFGQDSSFGANVTSGSANATDANGIGSFYYQPPTSALALCTANLPDPDIDPAVDDLPEDYFKAVTYTGTGSEQTISVGFQPDLVWMKGRSYAEHHNVIDSVRGAGKRIQPNRTEAEATSSEQLKSFTSTGFTLGTNHEVNNSSSTFIAWCWKAGGAPSGATSATGSAKRINSSGTQDDTSCSALATAASATITPTLMSINQKAGFSIVKWVGNNTNNSSIPHGLTQTPDFVVLKNTTDATNWGVKLNPSTISAVSNEQQYLYFNLTNPFGTNTGEETQLTSSIIKFVGTNLNFSNGSGDNMIAYCWHSVAGYSAFGSFTGNNSTDGPMIHLGFSPALVICKLYTGTSATDYHSWVIYDNVRQTVNPNHSPLYANRSHAEGKRGNTAGDSGGDTLYLDFLSNGFKCRQNGTELNGNGGSNDKFIYIAFAEQPFKYSATNAR